MSSETGGRGKRDKITSIPLFHTISQECIKKIEKQFPKYGNTWVDDFNQRFWKKRLQGEVKEVFEKGISMEKQNVELIDVINISAFMWTNNYKFVNQ